MNDLLQQLIVKLQALYTALQTSRSPVATTLPPNPPPMPPIGIDELYDDWSNPHHAYHNVRVLCDRAGLSHTQKDVLCACLYQESQFLNSAIGHNRNKAGQITSTDWGIVQCNDWFNIGPGKTWPSVEYVVNHPEELVNWMIHIYKNTGRLQPWASYTSGAYGKWLLSTSPMWLLALK